MNQISLTQPGADYHFFKKLLTWLLILTVFVVYIPLLPQMPTTTGDPSWMFGMNQAEAQGLVFGKDIVFTMGPYAAIYTKMYHPGTDGLMIFGSLVLACFNAFIIYKLSRQRSIYWQIFFIAFFSAGMFSRDTLLYSYPLLLAFYIYRQTGEKAGGLPQNFLQKLTYGLLFIPFGLLLLIKGSILTLEIGITGLAVLLFWKRKMKKLAVTICVVPVISAVVFTAIAKQPITGLWSYLINMIPITSGYSESMYVNGPNGEIVWYAITSVIMLFFCLRVKYNTIESKLLLVLSVALYLFIAFKGGFTRHDSHALNACTSLFLLGFLLHTIVNHKYLFVSFLLSALTWAYISFSYIGYVVFDVFKPVPGVYMESLAGLVKRMNGKGELKQSYYSRLEEIRNKEPHIPMMEGTCDLYSYEQSHLLATENKWSPRPILQSYSAYTDKLAQFNEAHLVGPNAPDNIIFRLQTIDWRMPALDDGLSWPTIINNYQPGNIDIGFLYLKKKRHHNIRPAKKQLYKIACKLHEEVIMPDTSQVLFAEFDIKQTLAGRIVTSLYQPDPLTIYITLTDGTQKNFRFIPVMSKSGYIFSPLIENIDDFVYLFNDPGHLKSRAIKSFKITNDGEGIRSKFTSWQTDYTLQLSKFEYDK